MSNPFRIFQRAWIVVPICALGFLLTTDGIRIRHREYVSEVAGEAAAGSDDLNGAVSLERVRPRLIIPGQGSESFEWLDGARLMLARHQWRLRQVDYENAPDGRDELTGSPYRWWLGLLSSLRRFAAGDPLVPSLEWAALFADPLLLLVLGTVVTFYAAGKFGANAACIGSVAAVTLFPLGGAFAPGFPDDRGLALVLGVLSLLVLAAALAGGAGLPDRQTQRGFALSGVLGGLALWVDASSAVVVLIGTAVGGVLCAGVGRIRDGRPLPWSRWALAGAATSFAGYLAEYAPSHMASWETRVNHPLFALAWLGAGELVLQLSGWIQGDAPARRARDWSRLVLAVAALTALPLSMNLSHDLGFLAMDLPTMRLSPLPGGAVAPTLWAWLLQNGLTPTLLATLLPVLFVVPAAALLAQSSIEPGRRKAVALTLGCVAVAFFFAWRQIHHWAEVDAALLVLFVVTPFNGKILLSRIFSWGVAGLAASILLPGALQLWPQSDLRAGRSLTDREALDLFQRDLSYWLAQHVGPARAVVLAPPDATTALFYYGGVRGLGTFGWQNGEGLGAAVRIASASTPEEAQVLIARRGVTHIVIPSWDPYLDAYAKIGEGQLEGTFLNRLHQWVLPPWLRAVPYLPPIIPGFEGYSVTVFEVIDEQEDANAASHLAEYFVDMGQLDRAADSALLLRRFPADGGALLARAEIAIAEGSSDLFSNLAEALIRRIGSGSDSDLGWDQRVRLSVAMAQAQRVDLARKELKQCVDEIDEEKLRSLSTPALYHFEVLKKALGLEIPDARLREMADGLLPSDLRNHLAK